MAYFPGAIRKDWIVDQKAHDEQVVIGYQCSCGDIHKVENNQNINILKKAFRCKIKNRHKLYVRVKAYKQVGTKKVYSVKWAK